MRMQQHSALGWKIVNTTLTCNPMLLGFIGKFDINNSIILLWEDLCI